MSADCVLAADVAGPALTLARFAPDPTGLRLEAARTLVIDQPAALAAAAGAGLRALAGGRPILGLGLSANGAMDPAGRRMVAGPPNLAPLKDAAFPAQLAAELGGPVRLVNRAQAALIGAAVRGQVSGSGTLGLLIIDFECGVAIWKNGRLWQPNRRPPALGELQTPAGAYDQLLNIAGLTGADQPPPARRAEDVPARRETYLAHLAQCVANLARLYFIDTVLIAGRLVAAAAAAGVD
ncbi:MAG: ROK family protein, partial [Anaerolineales bacterium]|nr:ROK family protein [Anaerolineales bacterium]